MSSLGYAMMLAPRDVNELGGGLGLSEQEEGDANIKTKSYELANMILRANCISAPHKSDSNVPLPDGEKVKQENRGIDKGRDPKDDDNDDEDDDTDDEDDDDEDDEKSHNVSTAETSQRQGVVVFTGAGISTPCGIPDFRGPNGVWTAQSNGSALPELHIPFGAARPSLTHIALTELVRQNYVRYVVSQNVDGLHVRAGLKRKSQLAEIHGNRFLEKCRKCNEEYVRDFETETLGFKCSKNNKRTCKKVIVSDGEEQICSGRLHDMTLDWESALPEDEYQRSILETESSNLVLCLGTSLRIRPICNVPQRVLKQRKTDSMSDGSSGQMAIVNLQKTRKDEKASLVIHAKCDDVLYNVVKALDVKLPVWYRKDGISYAYTIKENDDSDHALKEAENVTTISARRSVSKMTLMVYLRGRGGEGCGIPWLDSANVKFPKSCSARGGDMKQYLKHQNCLSLKRTIDSNDLPMTLTITMRVKEKWDNVAKLWHNEDFNKIRSAFPCSVDDSQYLGGKGELLRSVRLTVTKEDRSKEEVREFIGDSYDVQQLIVNELSSSRRTDSKTFPYAYVRHSRIYFV